MIVVERPSGCVSGDAGVEIYWLPLGAGGRFVRWNGRAYEAIVAAHEHRPLRPLFHAALEIHLDGTRHVVEMAPVWNERSPLRGVVVEGPVGARRLGCLRAFRYEVRCWRDGRISDVAEAVDSPQQVSADHARAAAILRVVPTVPSLTWGRDEIGAGDMWNSNSLVSWALARSGHDMERITVPCGGRAPGWQAGLTLALRQEAGSEWAALSAIATTASPR